MTKPKPIVERPVLHHVTFKTTRLQEMQDWYETVVGCKPSFSAPIAAWTTNDTANHRIAFLALPGIEEDPDKIKHANMHHTAFEFGTHQALFDNYERLADGGILPVICLDHGLTMSFYYADPDDNLVELQADNFGNWVHSTRWMQISEDFKNNPIGVEVDPPKMIKALKDGMALSDLLKASRSGDFLPETPGKSFLPTPAA